MLGEDYRWLFNTERVRDAVETYNMTRHRAFDYIYTPRQVQADPEIEEYYIREHIYKLEEAERKQRLAGFYTYQTGDVLLIHLDLKRYSARFEKVRRVLNRLARFIGYENGNVRCTLFFLNENNTMIYSKDPENSFILPIYHTKFLCHEGETIPQEYLKLLIAK
jgi:hypothetical protein